MSYLPDLDLSSVLDSSTADLVADFYKPALAVSVQYDRGVGYFSSGWLRLVAQGMNQFAANGGRARILTSPILDEADWQALQTGDAARTDPILYAALTQNIADLEQHLEADTRSALAWMVADGILTFKLALPQNKLAGGDFHDKFGIFADGQGERVSFNGSPNESVRGVYNYESLKIFKSWEPAFAPLVEADRQRFERLWNNEDLNVRVFELPEAAREQILQLREGERPYPEPEWVKLRRIKEGAVTYQTARPHIPPQIILRPYQEEAIEAWFNNNNRGLFEMATGTGKTITALATAVRLFHQKKRLIFVVACPHKHLVNQWANEARQFGFRPICVAEARSKWEDDVATELRDFRKQYNDIVTLITTNKSLTEGRFPELMQEMWHDTLFISDEAHYAGAAVMLRSLPQDSPWRLGLSATPIRHYDEDGSEGILDYFGDIVFSFPLEKAIGEFLTPYYYHPIPVEMTEDEFAEYCVLTEKLRKHIHTENDQLSEVGQKIAIQRARVQNNSVSKLDWLQENIERYAKFKHALFYVGDRIFPDVQQLLGLEKRVRIHEFTHRQTSNEERQQILTRFANGDLQALVAMKCLDEGVDVPPTRTAYFLASSGNPREFVQRRGRVLRRFEGKDFATIYDLISMPPMDYIEMGSAHPEYNAIRAAIRREYRRIQEFASMAENHYQSLDGMFDIVQQLNLLSEE
jgi:superfamily II DNA or RNA helicase